MSDIIPCPFCGDPMEYWSGTGKWRWRGKTYYGTPYDTANFIAKREQNDGARDE